MEKHSIIICILLAIITTNLIRVVPMLLIKGQISNRFLRSFLYYVPYVTLAVMDHLVTPVRHRCPRSRHHSRLASHGSLPRCYYLLRHRLSDGHADTIRFCNDEYSQVLPTVRRRESRVWGLSPPL